MLHSFCERVIPSDFFGVEFVEAVRLIAELFKFLKTSNYYTFFLTQIKPVRRPSTVRFCSFPLIHLVSYVCAGQGILKIFK